MCIVDRADDQRATPVHSIFDGYSFSINRLLPGRPIDAAACWTGRCGLRGQINFYPLCGARSAAPVSVVDTDISDPHLVRWLVPMGQLLIRSFPLISFDQKSQPPLSSNLIYGRTSSTRRLGCTTILLTESLIGYFYSNRLVTAAFRPVV